jgi:hypothetical protein
LIEDLFSGCLPLFFWEDLDDDHVTIHRTVHGFSTDEQNWLVQGGYSDGCLIVSLAKRAVMGSHL